MIPSVVKEYIQERYDSWLDYSKHLSEKANMQDQSIDVLNEVYIMLSEKDEDVLLKLYNAKKGEYRELDYYVLRMIRTNIQLSTSPYQWKYNRNKIDENKNVESVYIEDLEEDSEDEEHLSQIESIYKKVKFNSFERNVYDHIVFYRLPVKSWDGKESKHSVYVAFRLVKNVIRIIADKENNNCDIEKRLTGCSKRERELIENYFERSRACRVIKTLYLSQEAQNLFEIKYIQCNNILEWCGSWKKKEIQKKYDKILSLYHAKLNNLLLF